MARVFLLAAAEQERLKMRELLERRKIRATSRPMLLPDNSFVDTFRLSKENFTSLCEDLIPLLPNQRNTSVRPEIKILTALQFYGSGSYQRIVGDHRLVGIAQTTTSKVVNEVTNALNAPHILKKYIKFPGSQNEREAISQRFMEKFGFPGVIGCIDGTHCAIIRPNDYEEAYFNRKYYHSLNVMVICDADLRILHVDASYGGASHDSHVWNGSPVKALMERLHEEGQYFWFLGDSGYAQRPWLMTPILGARPDTPEEHYTSVHTSTRNVVERCFGVLKTRFRCLLAHRVMHYDPIKAGKIVNACVVLHNLINDHRISIDSEAIELDNNRQPHPVPFVGNRRLTNEGRDAIVARLWRTHLALRRQQQRDQQQREQRQRQD